MKELIYLSSVIKLQPIIKFITITIRFVNFKCITIITTIIIKVIAKLNYSIFSYQLVIAIKEVIEKEGCLTEFIIVIIIITLGMECCYSRRTMVDYQ